MAQQIQQIIKKIKLDTFDSNQSLAFIKIRTGLKPSQISFAVIIFLFIILIIAQASTLVLSIGCFIVPAYFSFISLQSSNINQSIKYLTYWVVFSFTEIFSGVLEYMLGTILYAVLRVGFTIIMLHSSTQLSQKIYHKVISPYVMGNQKSLDKKIQQIPAMAKNKFDEIEKRVKPQFNNLMKKIQ